MPIIHRTEIERHIGKRIRQRRKSWNASQELIAEALGISYQQLQKYEAGKNRIPASMLYEIARLLDVQVTFFFDGQ